MNDRTALLHAVAREQAPRPFALVEECDGGGARAAGYGLAYADRVESNSVEGDFQLRSECAENARALYEATNRDRAVRRVHLVWLDTTPDDRT